MKLSIHQFGAMCWVTIAVVIFYPISMASPMPHANIIFKCCIVQVTAMYFYIPLLLKWPTFRRWYCWTDAMSERQFQAFSKTSIQQYNQTAFYKDDEERYLSALKPYIRRLSWTAAGLFVLSILLQKDLVLVSIVFSFSVFYPLSVLFMVYVSTLKLKVSWRK